MNKSRRKILSETATKLRDIAEIVDRVLGEEMDCLSNLPESFAMSERGESMEYAIDNLDEAYNNISDAITAIEQSIV